jgi:hypothetical protein
LQLVPELPWAIAPHFNPLSTHVFFRRTRLLCIGSLNDTVSLVVGTVTISFSLGLFLLLPVPIPRKDYLPLTINSRRRPPQDPAWMRKLSHLIVMLFMGTVHQPWLVFLVT